MKRPIKICVPVNLKRYFSSKTISNFFSYITVEANQQSIMENDKLKELKEFILPLLMNGQINIDDIEIKSDKL